MKRLAQASLVLLLAPLAACEYHKLQELNYAEPSGEPFQKALFANYRDLTRQEERAYDWSQAVIYADKALHAAYGDNVLPSDPAQYELPDGFTKHFEKAREDLLNIIAGDAKEVRPQLVADAQTYFDCWLENQAENANVDEIAYCRDGFYFSMQELITPEPAAEEPKKEKPKAKAKPKAKPAAKSLTPKPAPKPEPVKEQPKPEPVAVKEEPKPEPAKVEPKPEPVKEEPKIEAKPEVKTEPAPAKEEPKAETKSEPAPAPAVEAEKPQTPAAAVEPAPAPAAATTAPAEAPKPAVAPFSPPPAQESKPTPPPAAAPAEPAAAPKPQSSLGKPAKEIETASYIVFFDAGKASLDGNAEKIVDGAAQSLAKHKNYRVVVNARNDLFGNLESALPGQRAEMVKNRLILQGIPESSIDVLLAGEASPAAGAQSGPPVTRRVEIFVSE